jgi:hypothetical protein
MMVFIVIGLKFIMASQRTQFIGTGPKRATGTLLLGPYHGIASICGT